MGKCQRASGKSANQEQENSRSGVRLSNHPEQGNASTENPLHAHGSSSKHIGTGWTLVAAYLTKPNRVTVSYELTAANVAEVRLVGELLGDARLGEDLARRSLGDLAYRSEESEGEPTEAGIALVTECSRQSGKRQQAEVSFSALKRTFGIDLAPAKTLVGLTTRIAAKIAAYTYAFYVNRLLGRPQGRMKDLWA